MHYNDQLNISGTASCLYVLLNSLSITIGTDKNTQKGHRDEIDCIAWLRLCNLNHINIVDKGTHCIKFFFLPKFLKFALKSQHFNGNITSSFGSLWPLSSVSFSNAADRYFSSKNLFPSGIVKTKTELKAEVILDSHQVAKHDSK